MSKKTKIIATVGPACQTKEKLAALLRAGVDIFRINASHTTPRTLRKWILLVREASLRAKHPAPVLVDFQGPRIRTGKLKGGKAVTLKNGQKLSISYGKKPGDAGAVMTSCRQFSRMVKRGDTVLVDNGRMSLRVDEVRNGKVQCRVEIGGLLGENKGINLPSAPATLPALTKQDEESLVIAQKMKVAFVALSFVRTVDDIKFLRRKMKARRFDIPVIAKIEKPRAVHEQVPIFEAADGVMIARGDLGIEMGLEKVPAIQKRLIDHANETGIPVITATQMLETMMEEPQPTRAEVSDIANAVFDGTDAVMLSGETAVGKYPVKAVKMMKRIILEAERQTKQEKHHLLDRSCARFKPESFAITHAAYHAAWELGATAVIVFTVSGRIAQLVSKHRPLSRIIALTFSEHSAERLALLRGVTPFVVRYSNNTDQMIRDADRMLLKRKILKKGDSVVLVSGEQALAGARFMTKLHRIGED